MLSPVRKPRSKECRPNLSNFSTRTNTSGSTSGEIFRFAPFSMPNYGPCVIEDFVPISDNRALVTAGKHLRLLEFILEVSFEFGDTLWVYDPEVLRRGRYLRLGHLFEGSLVFSDGWEG